MGTSLASILHSEGVFVAFTNTVLPLAPKIVIFNFIMSSAFISCHSSAKNSSHQLFDYLKKSIAKAKQTRFFSFVHRFSD